MKYVIVGTAGHVDHGKTELTKALTGFDSDRLKEEKERGISIKLGFAPFVLENGQKVGLVDVPGHERFIKQMLSGAAGMDLVLLVVAADEGIMPQTKEHIDILRLLGVSRAIVVISKKDLVEEDWLELVQEEVREYLEPTPYAKSPLVAVSAYTGEGIDALKRLIQQEVEEVSQKPVTGKPRLPIDRVFSIKGFGTVVTGTLWSGQIDLNDALSIMPQGIKTRARHLQVHGENKESAYAGQRVAINLADVEVKDIEHGSMLVPEGLLEPSFRMDMELFLLEHAKELKHRTRVHVHVGTAEVLARVYLLEGDTLLPGEQALVQLHCEEPVVASRHDRVVLRTYSPVITLGGGEVIDPNPSKHKRFDQNTLSILRLQQEGTLADILLQILQQEGPMKPKDLESKVDVPEEQWKEAMSGLQMEGKVLLLEDQYISLDEKHHKEKKLLGLLITYQEKYPLRWGLSKEEARSRLFGSYSNKAYNALLQMLVQEERIALHESLLHTPDFEPRPSIDEQEAIDALEKKFVDGQFLPPDPMEACRMYAQGSEYLQYLLGTKRLVKINEEIVFSRLAYEEAKSRILHYLEEHHTMVLGDARDLLDSSRKYVLPLLEHFDEKKMTRRVEDKRILVRR